MTDRVETLHAPHGIDLSLADFIEQGRARARARANEQRPPMTVCDLMRELLGCDPEALVFLDGEDDLMRGFIMCGPDAQKSAPHGWVRLTR